MLNISIIIEDFSKNYYLFIANYLISFYYHLFIDIKYFTFTIKII